MKQLIPLALSVNTLTVMWLVGNKRTLGWTLALIGQSVWFLFIFVFEAWGLLPLAIGLTVVYARNLWHWYRIMQIDSQIEPNEQHLRAVRGYGQRVASERGE